MTDIDLTVVRGDSRTIRATITNPDGSATDLTGKRLLFAAKRRPSGPALIAKSSATGGITIVNSAGGIADVALDPADTSGFGDVTVLLWDMQLDDNPGIPRTVASGTLRIVPDIAA